jgi:hypothetical protein
MLIYKIITIRRAKNVSIRLEHVAENPQPSSTIRVVMR